MGKKQKKITRWSAFLLCSFLLLGCQEEETKEAPVTKETVQEVVEEVEEVKYYAPLTGEEIEVEKNNRIVAVMINNHPKARPQTGLSDADLVFEILAEGNITRLLAMFQQHVPEVIGPVRSARPYYFNLADDYGALYVYHGAAGFIEDMLKNGAADHLNGAYYDNDLVHFKRESFRKAPHNSYLLTPGLYDEATRKNYDVTQRVTPYTFTDDVSASFAPAKGALFYYGNEAVKYLYDETTERYQRYHNDTLTVELENEREIALANVLIIEAEHTVIDDAGRRDVDLNSGGQGILLQKGQQKAVQWENRDGQIVPIAQGEVIPFIPGKTWVNVIPPSVNMESVTILTE